MFHCRFDKVVAGHFCSDCASSSDQEQSYVDLVDCLVVLIRRGFWRSMRCELRSLTQPSMVVGHAGRTVGRVWGSVHALGPTWHFARWPVQCEETFEGNVLSSVCCVAACVSQPHSFPMPVLVRWRTMQHLP